MLTISFFKESISLVLSRAVSDKKENDCAKRLLTLKR